MQTLSYGYQLPTSGDKGSTLWTALEGDIQQLNNHSHDGSNSSLISASDIGSTQVSISNANWASYGGPIGHFRQLVTMAPGYTFDQKNVNIRTAAGEYLPGCVVRNDNTTFYVYSTDPGLELVAVYGG